LRKALASTRKILPPLNTSYVKGRGSSTCILLQELGIYDEGGHITIVINAGCVTDILRAFKASEEINVPVSSQILDERSDRQFQH
jgi:hypothetical protein